MDKQIEEMAKVIFEYVDSKDRKNVYIVHSGIAEDMKTYSHNYGVAKALYNANCRILDEGSVVISKEEYEALRLIEKYYIKSCGKNSVVLTTEELEEIRKQAVKEYAEKLHSSLDKSIPALNGVLVMLVKNIVDNTAKELGVKLQKSVEICKNTQKHANFENHTSDPDWN